MQNAFAQMEQSRSQVAILRGEILPEARETLELIQKGYALGRFSYLELVQARQQVLAVENDAVLAATDFHQTLITLEALTGQPLTGRRQTFTGVGNAIDASAEHRLPYLNGSEAVEQTR